MLLKKFLRIFSKIIYKLYKKIFKRKELRILKDFNHDCNEFYNSYINDEFLLSDSIEYGLRYEIVNPEAGVMIYKNYQGVGFVQHHFHVKNEVTGIYIETIVNKLLKSESTKEN